MHANARLVVDIARLRDEGERLTGELDTAALELGTADDLVTPASDLAYDLKVERLGQELLVRGLAEMEINCVCSRCAESFRMHVTERDIVGAFSLEENPEFVDLTDELREAMILSFPPYPVCGETCRGLCPRCGKNLNNGPCGCKSEDRDDRWGVLDGLKLQE